MTWKTDWTWAEAAILRAALTGLRMPKGLIISPLQYTLMRQWEYDAGRERLIGRGLLNNRGDITPEGRQAAQDALPKRRL